MKLSLAHMPTIMPTAYCGRNDVRAFGKWEIMREGYGG